MDEDHNSKDINDDSNDNKWRSPRLVLIGSTTDTEAAANGMADGGSAQS